MKKLRICMLMLCLLLLIGCTAKEPVPNQVFIHADDTLYDTKMKQDLLCLMLAYPEYITDIAVESDGRVYAVMKSGKKLLYDDKKVKSPEGKIAFPDLQDMMAQEYPLTPIRSLMDQNFDPGRCRVYGLLNEVYGASRQQVQSNLINVRSGYGTQQFNGNNQAAAALKNVMQELAALAQSRQDIRGNVFPCNGTFNYRYIADTNRLSPHAFGIAIDLARDKRDYWKWASAAQGQSRIASYPVEIVQIFEKNNFIWGGKWGHFDILHYEYRPEIILKARYFGNQSISGKPWFGSVSLEDTAIRNAVEKIEQTIR